MYEIAQCQEEFNLCPGGNEQNGYGGELKKNTTTKDPENNQRETLLGKRTERMRMLKNMTRYMATC